MSTEGQDYIVACVIATEVPPQPTGTFTAEMIPIAVQAVCDVIRNRTMSGHFRPTAVGVVLQPRQFSAVCAQDYWREAMAGRWFPGHVQHCLETWQAKRPPVAVGATFYFSPVSMEPPGSAPAWAAKLHEVQVAGLDKNYFRFFKGD